MANEIQVSGLSPSTTEAQVSDFFGFCGKVNSVKLDSAEGKAHVTFEKASAISTALLLSESELNGSKVTITADESAAQAAASKEHGEEQATPHGDDVPQEYKPKSAILAEYLSHGYVLGDKAISRGIELDNKHGFSSRFTSFLQHVDGKYHDTKSTLDDKYKLHEKTESLRTTADATDKAYGISENIQKGQAAVNKYVDDALATETGSKIRGFYSNLVKNVSDVHNEARRLADLKKETPAGETTASDATSAATTTDAPSATGAPGVTDATGAPKAGDTTSSSLLD